MPGQPDWLFKHRQTPPNPPPGPLREQVGFFNVVVLPLFEAFAGAMPQGKPMLEAATSNRDFWKLEEQRQQQRQQAACREGGSPAAEELAGGPPKAGMAAPAAAQQQPLRVPAAVALDA